MSAADEAQEQVAVQQVYMKGLQVFFTGVLEHFRSTTSAEWDWEAISARFQNDAALAIPCPQRLRLLGDYFLDDSRHGFTLPATALLAAKLKEMTDERAAAAMSVLAHCTVRQGSSATVLPRTSASPATTESPPGGTSCRKSLRAWDETAEITTMEAEENQRPKRAKQMIDADAVEQAAAMPQRVASSLAVRIEAALQAEARTAADACATNCQAFRGDETQFSPLVARGMLLTPPSPARPTWPPLLDISSGITIALTPNTQRALRSAEDETSPFPTPGRGLAWEAKACVSPQMPPLALTPPRHPRQGAPSTLSALATVKEPAAREAGQDAADSVDSPDTSGPCSP